MGLIGETLRRERLKYGLDLHRIAQETKIPARLLEAIERDEFDKLPGRLFTISFVRQYAHRLGLDEEQMVADLRVQQEPPPEVMAEPAPPKPTRKFFRIAFAGLAAVLLIALVVSGLRWSSRALRVGTKQPVAAEVSQGAADRVRDFARVEPRPGPAGAASGSVTAPLRLVLTAKDRTWVAVKRERQTVFAGTLQPKESKMLEEAGALDVVIANPSRLEVRLNGEAIDISGPQGQLAEVRIPWPEGKPTIAHRTPFEDIY